MSNVQTTTFPGARYVTKFADPIEWDSSNAYEAIEAVQHQGFSYISKRPVPAGIEITDTRYWLLWADPNAQIGSLREDLDELGEDLDGVSDRVTAIENAKTDIIVIGDSYSKYSYDYSNGVVVQSGDELWNKVKANSSIENVYNYAVGGAGFINTTYTAKTFYAQLTDAIADAHDVDKLRKVIVFGGTNDYALDNLSGMQSALSQLMALYAGSIYKDVPLCIVFNKAGYSSNRHHDINALMLRGKVTSSNANVTFVNAGGYLCGYPQLGNDNVHPNTFGYNNLARLMCAIVEGQPLPMTNSVQLTPTLAEDDPVTLQLSDAFIKDNMLYISGRIRLAAGVNISTERRTLFRVECCGQAFQNAKPLSWNYSSAATKNNTEKLHTAVIEFDTAQDGVDGTVNVQILNLNSTDMLGTAAIINFYGIYPL